MPANAATVAPAGNRAGLALEALRMIAQARCEADWQDRQFCFEHFPNDRHRWCWPCFARYVLRAGVVR